MESRKSYAQAPFLQFHFLQILSWENACYRKLLAFCWSIDQATVKGDKEHLGREYTGINKCGQANVNTVLNYHFCGPSNFWKVFSSHRTFKEHLAPFMGILWHHCLPIFTRPTQTQSSSFYRSNLNTLPTALLGLCACCKLSHFSVSDFLRPHGLYIVRQGPLFMGFSRQEYWSGLLCPPPGDLPNPGITPRSPALQVDS